MKSSSDVRESPSRLLTQDEAATRLNLSPRTLEAFRCRGGGPPFVRISARAIRYRESDLDRWIEARIQRSTSEYPESSEAA